uniref:MULE domain-containing protein n=1 Tax=Strongyloides venezuelensis TaxID=75913 RepID=A0A0K0FSE3_STRVS
MTQIYLSNNEISASQMLKAVNNQFGSSSISLTTGRRHISENGKLYCSGCRRIGNKFYKTIRRALGSGHENECQQVSFISVLCKSIEIHYCDKISSDFVMPSDCNKLYLRSLAQLAFENQINFHDILLYNDFPKLETIYESFRKCKTRSFNKIIDYIDKCIYSNNEKMIFDNYEEGFVAIISPPMLEEFSKTSYIVADATSSTYPKPFKYLYCLHSLNIECLKSVTLCYFLMYTKDANAFDRCLLWLEKQANEYCLKNVLIFNTNKTIMTDKERYFLKSVRRVYPSFNRKLCFFHYKKCIRKHLIKFNLLGTVNKKLKMTLRSHNNNYKKNALKKRLAVLVLNLPFIKTDDLVDYRSTLEDEYKKLSNENEFIFYYKNEWLKEFDSYTRK